MPSQQPDYGQLPAPAHGPEQYEFIMNSGSKRPGKIFTGTTNFSRLFVVIGGALVLIIVAWVFLAIINSGPHADGAALVNITLQQNELATISQGPLNTPSAQSTRNFAETAQLNLLTERLLFRTYLIKHGVKSAPKPPKSLSAAATDAALKDAQTNGNYDEVFISTAQQQLAAYQRALGDTYKAATLPSEKALLKKAFDESDLLYDLSKQQ